MATSALIDTRAWDALVRRVKGIGNRKIAVGVFGDAELSEIAAIHEYGAPRANIPERSFIRSTLFERRRQIDNFMKRLGTAYLAKGLSVAQVLGLLGTFAANSIKAKIRTDIPPPLQPATIKAKGSSKALIDTGRLINAITWKIVE